MWLWLLKVYTLLIKIITNNSSICTTLTRAQQMANIDCYLESMTVYSSSIWLIVVYSASQHQDIDISNRSRKAKTIVASSTHWHQRQDGNIYTLTMIDLFSYQSQKSRRNVSLWFAILVMSTRKMDFILANVCKNGFSLYTSKILIFNQKIRVVWIAANTL